MRVADLSYQLDHPDLATQTEAVDLLVAAGVEAIDDIAANFEFVTPRARRALVVALQRIADQRALLPLMRFVWDRRGSIEDSDARALAMKAISEIARPEHGAKLLGFLLDVGQDEDAFVRGWTAETLARFGDPRAKALLQDFLKDPSDVVRERAERALRSLKDAGSDALRPAVTDQELIQAVRGSRAAEQSYWLEELQSRPNAFELAAMLAREPGRTQILGLHHLQASGDPRARAIVMQMMLRDPESEHRAVALRILAQHLHGDADADELALIRDSLYNGDSFVRAAALESAARSGDADLVGRAIGALRDPDLETAHAAARGLSRGLGPNHRHHYPQLLEAFEHAHRVRLRQNDELSARCEAYVVRALGRVLGDSPLGLDGARAAALKALFDAEAHRPVLVTALDLLEQTTPAQGLVEASRWPAGSVRDLAMLLGHADREVRIKALGLLARGAAAGNDALVAGAERLAFEDDGTLVGALIPLLERIGTPRARHVLTQLAQDSRPAVASAADEASRRWRNAQEWIDAEFDDTF